MPTGPKGERRPADVIGNAVHVMRIAHAGLIGLTKRAISSITNKRIGENATPQSHEARS
jgi:hypothetical protein